VYKYIFFTNVLRILDERGMTKNELSERSGVSISFLSDLTTGKANPSLKVMEAIASALETPLPLLLESTDLDKNTLDALAGGNGLATQEIAGAIELTPRATRTRLAKLVERGLVREIGTSPQDPKRRYFRAR